MIGDHPMPRYYEAVRTQAALVETYERSIVDLTLRIAKVRTAHDWQCDCTPDDPCRIFIALNGGPSRPEYDS